MKNEASEHLPLVSPEYQAAMDELSQAAAEVMDMYPETVLYEKGHTYLYLKAPTCKDNQYYQLYRNLLAPTLVDTPTGSKISTQVSLISEHDGGTARGTSHIQNEGGVLVRRFCWSDDLADDFEDDHVTPLFLHQIQNITADIKEGTPLRNEIQKTKQKSLVARFLGSILKLRSR